jgi:hypothetical protein
MVRSIDSVISMNSSIRIVSSACRRHRKKPDAKTTCSYKKFYINKEAEFKIKAFTHHSIGKERESGNSKTSEEPAFLLITKCNHTLLARPPPGISEHR